MSNTNLQPNPYEQQPTIFIKDKYSQQVNLAPAAHTIPRPTVEKQKKLRLPKTNGPVDFWRRAFDFTGTSTRWDYLSSQLVYWFIVVIFAVVSAIVAGLLRGDSTIATVAILIILAVGFIPNVSLRVRRLRDAGYSPWWLLLHLIGFNLIPELLCLLLPTSTKPAWMK